MDRPFADRFVSRYTIGADMKVGDLVRPKTRDTHRGAIDRDERRIGLVTKVNTGYDGEQIEVLWNKPTWFNPKTGYSSEYIDTLEVIR